MTRKIIALVLCITFLSVCTLVAAEDVFVTENGSKYHKETCRFVKDKENVEKISKKEAVSTGYEPCGRCYKEDLALVEEKPKKVKQVTKK